MPVVANGMADRRGCPGAAGSLPPVWAGVGRAGVRAFLRSVGTEQPHWLTERTLEILAPYATAASAPFGAVIARWDAFRARKLTWVDGFDLIVCPAHSRPALPQGAAHDHDAEFAYTATHNLTGWPEAVVRSGTSPEGLPIGVQLVAHPWREDVALAAARDEANLGGWRPSPV